MRTPRECRVTRRAIDEGATEAAQPVRAHIAACGSCREFHDQHLRLSELVGSLQPVTAPEDFDIRLRARLLRERGERKRFAVPGFAFGTPAIAAAAGAVVLVGAVFLVSRLGNSTSPARAVVSKPAPPENLAMSVDSGDQSGSMDSGSSTAQSKPSPGLSRQANLSSGSKRKTVESYDEVVKAAPRIVKNRGEQSAAEISLSQPFEFSLQDSQGVTRKFTLPPVTFGSQQLVRRGQPYQSVSYTGRVW